MAVQYIHAEKGNIFKPTAYGMSIGRVASKYKDSSRKINKQYLICVPKSWVTNGYVKQVAEGEDD